MENFSELFLNKTIIYIEKSESDNKLTFVLNDYAVLEMFHSTDCCEHVYLADMVGDLNDLLNSPILLADCSSNRTDNPPSDRTPDSYTWTYYKLATIKGYVDFRWFGESNGYYSESVDVRNMESYELSDKYKKILTFIELQNNIPHKIDEYQDFKKIKI